MLSDFPRKGHTASGTIRMQSWSCPCGTLPVSNSLQNEYSYPHFFIEEESDTHEQEERQKCKNKHLDFTEFSLTAYALYRYIADHSSVDEKCLNAI